MKILNNNISSLSNIAFQKQLVAKAGILSNNGQQKQVKIYHLNESNDAKCFQDALNDNEWKDNFYLEEASACFKDDYRKLDYYAMEDSEHNLLCYSILNKRNRRKNLLTCIETMPAQSCYADNKRKYKYIGETMLAFLAKETREQEKDFQVSSVAERPKTKHFYYEQCGFTPYEKHDAIMKTKDLKNLIAQNEKHTKSKIKLLA